MQELNYHDIGGWFDYEELYKEVVRRAKDGARFVEVGCWLGKSFAFLCQEVTKSGKDIHLYAVDNWAGSPCDGLDRTAREYNASAKPLFLRFEENIRPFAERLKTSATAITGDSAESACKFENHSLDFVFIDADHSYEAVKRDVLSWFPKMKPGGVIAGHDYNRDSVHNAVRDAFESIGIVKSRCGFASPCCPTSWWFELDNT